MVSSLMNLNQTSSDMRTIDDIKKEIRSNFVTDNTLQEMYGLIPSKSFEEQFSKVSLEAIITYIVAVSIWVFENILFQHKIEIENKITRKANFSIPWYHQMALNFQIGDFLELDESTLMWKYPINKDGNKIIKYASVRTLTIEGVSKLQFFVSKEGKKPLTASELLAFETYIKEIGAAGTHFEVISKDPTRMSFDIMIVRDPMVLDFEGKSLSNGKEVVKLAINDYLSGILYGGTFNRTKMIDALQEVSGIKDIILTEVRAEGQSIYGQDYESISGSFSLDESTTRIDYKI